MSPFSRILIAASALVPLPALAQGPGAGPPPEGGMNRAPKLTRAEEIRIYLTLDANADGNLSKDEVPARLHGLFTRADLDRDAIITPAELAAMVEKRFTAMAARGEERGGPPRAGGRPPGPPPAVKQP